MLGILVSGTQCKMQSELVVLLNLENRKLDVRIVMAYITLY